MPARNAILDLITIWLTFLRFTDPYDAQKLLLGDIVFDHALVITGALQLRQTVRRGREAGRYENLAVSLYLLLMVDALASDCKDYSAYRGWYG